MRFRIQNTNVLLFAALYGYKHDFLLEGKNTNCKHLRTRQANFVKRNTEARSCNYCCNKKAVWITYFECVSAALGIQHVMNMRLLTSVAYPALEYLSTLSNKCHYLKKVFGHKICVLILSTNCVWNIYHSKKNWARYDKSVYWFSCEVNVILVRF
jgi:hypothetical protein